jgi:hypothetical protein
LVPNIIAYACWRDSFVIIWAELFDFLIINKLFACFVIVVVIIWFVIVIVVSIIVVDDVDVVVNDINEVVDVFVDVC